MIVMVVNTKGGVGKSAFSMQLVAPYLLSRFGNASLFEVDDYNFDASDYDSSMVECQSIRVGNEIDRAAETLRIELSGKNAVIDVGGNETAGSLIEAIGKNRLYHTFGAIIIPVTQTGKDVENAEKTLAMIKEQFRGYKGKVFLGLTRIPSKYSWDDIAYRLPDLVKLAEKESVDGVITLPTDDSIPLSRKLGMTAWELSEFSETQLEQIEALMMEEHEKGASADRDRQMQLNRHTVTIESALRLRPHLDERFEHLDRKLGVTPEMTQDGLTPLEGPGLTDVASGASSAGDAAPAAG